LLAFALALSDGSALAENRLVDLALIFASAVAIADGADLGKNERAACIRLIGRSRAWDEGGADQIRGEQNGKTSHGRYSLMFSRRTSANSISLKIRSPMAT
jgi:hypothetical protein